MTVDQVFNLAAGLAMIGWVLMIIISPFWQRYDLVVVGIVCVIIAIAYTTLNVVNFKPDIFKKFTTLDGVMDLFTSRALVTAAWCHILAFDLLVAVWIKKNSLKHGISHLLLIPVFICAYVFGPFGFLLYIVIRWLKTGRYFAEN